MMDNQNNRHQTTRTGRGCRIVLAMITTMFTILLSSCGMFSDTGFFTMTLDPDPIDAQSIAISDSALSGFDKGQLHVTGSLGTTGLTYDGLPIGDILESEGFLQDTDKTYVSYAFHLTNTGTSTVFVNVVMRLTEVSYGMDDHIRVLVIKDDGTQSIFMKADTAEPQLSEADDLPYTVELFETETVIFWDAVTQLRPSEVVSFKVVMWADSDDPDLANADIRGALKAVMTFQIAGTEDRGTTMPGDRRLWITLMTVCDVTFDIRHENQTDRT